MRLRLAGAAIIPALAGANLHAAVAPPALLSAPALGLGLDPNLPQSGGWVLEPGPDELGGRAPTAASAAWTVWASGYLRAPLRLSWGPPTTPDPSGGNPGTQLRTPPLVPNASDTDWRYTGDYVPPWTELDFHVGNPHVLATVQIASLNITDASYRRLDANLGINQAFLTIHFPELQGGNLHLAITAGGFTNRYGAAGRFDAGKYDTFLFGRTHVAGETTTLAYAAGPWTVTVEHGFGGKLEPVPFYKTPSQDPTMPPTDPARVWDPQSGPVPQESTFVHHGHLGLRYRDALLLAAHAIDVFANDNERAGGYIAMNYQRSAATASPRVIIVGGEAKWRSAAFGDGYLGYAHLDARNADYLGAAIDVLHSAEGWQLHDNFFGAAGADERATGRIDTVLFQQVVSIARLLRHGRALSGEGEGEGGVFNGAYHGPDLIASVFAMYNQVQGAIDPAFDHGKLKTGGELTYLPMPWLGIGGRFDFIAPNLGDRSQTFSVASPRLVLRTAFLTHEQILIGYSRYFYGAGAAHGPFPYGDQRFAQGLGADRNAAQIAAVIWF